ncbi:MAG: glycogen debranching protein GlgX [Legionellales bacterium]|nr:glycogen debranching protein GlgX [Legionellales bacterium]
MAELTLGTQVLPEGVNFAIFSRHATRVCLEFYAQPQDAMPIRVIDLAPAGHRTGDVWHIFVENSQLTPFYAYRIDGPYQPEKGHRFDFDKLLLDPYAKAINALPDWDFRFAKNADQRSHHNNASTTPKCILVNDSFDWQGTHPPKHPWSKTIIYETHVRGLTIHPSAEVKYPGTYRGVIEKIPYFKKLGITALELMPVQEFNENEINQLNPLTAEPLRNYWGYSTVAFFAPKASYSSENNLGQQVTEFKEMVRALHQADIEVILDMVLNHTAESDENGFTLFFRGIDNVIYYFLAEDKRHYLDFTGTKNTLNTNHPVMQDFILDVLRYWVTEMHVDGFRIDEAIILNRDETGELQDPSCLIKRIAEDPILRDIKLIAEPWDATGAHQMGHFDGKQWAEWNGIFRDNIHRFWLTDEHSVSAFARCFGGSAELFVRHGKTPQNSINFVSCHDGFTLNDLVSYQQKHNEGNAQNNQDGSNQNFSNNHGVEGVTSIPAIELLRRRQIKNFLLTLLVAKGVPMLLGGDEFCRTQQGNNNAYCQDNVISWYDWEYLKRHQEIWRFTQAMIAFRKHHFALSEPFFYTPESIHWLTPQGGVPDWINSQAKQIACLIEEHGVHALYMMFNAGENDAWFTLPSPPAKYCWHIAADTSCASPNDVFFQGEEPELKEVKKYLLKSHSSAILIAKSQNSKAILI